MNDIEQKWVMVEATADQVWHAMKRWEEVIKIIGRKPDIIYQLPKEMVENLINITFNVISGELMLRNHKVEQIEEN